MQPIGRCAKRGSRELGAYHCTFPSRDLRREMGRRLLRGSLRAFVLGRKFPHLHPCGAGDVYGSRPAARTNPDLVMARRRSPLPGHSGAASRLEVALNDFARTRRL